MANKRLIKFYKGIVLPELLKAIRKDVGCQKDELDVWLKRKFFADNVSTLKMTNDELLEIIYFCFELGDEIGIYINFPNNEFEID
jgi:hypothetical protein